VNAPTPKLRDERLCWLAVEDKLHRRAKRGTAFLIGFSNGARRGASLSNQNVARGFASAKLRKYAIAVDSVSNRLNPQEREVLRATGQVPEWFLAAVLVEARKVKLR